MTAKVYVIAQFKPKAGKEQALFNTLKALEPNSYREEGCLQYTVTRQVAHPNATRNEFPIVFNEIWTNGDTWAAHCNRKEIQDFFLKEVVDADGLVEDVSVTAYTDEGEDFDAAVFPSA